MNRYSKKYYIVTSIVFSIVLSLITFNFIAPQLSYFNIKIRNYIVHRSLHKFTFTKEGIPEQLNPRLGKYISPFYVVHFGLLYSESCRDLIDDSKPYWFKDQTLKYWFGHPPSPSLQRFQATLDWLLANADKATFGVTHLLYNFDWPYSGYPGGVIQSPWWSGLTDGYAILLLLRGYDCFGDVSYLELARELYSSVLTPVSYGGSLAYWDDTPWIEEYVDPRAAPDQLSHVFNGMAYAYFGVLAFEQSQPTNKAMSDLLLASIAQHIYDFDMGYWSYYDGKQNPANIKYHRINWALTTDSRISPVIPAQMKRRWAVGVKYPSMYLLYGSTTISYYHLLLELCLLVIIYYLIIMGVINHKYIRK